MYNEYFGLQHTPFRLTPDTRLFYSGGGRGEVLDALIYAITSGEGIIKVVGEVGTGKTMLCRMLEERLPDTVDIVYLANPSLTPEDILHAIALELGLEIEMSASRIQLMHSLQQALLERHARNRRVVALVEEAQSMPRDTLEEIRLLSNLETKSEKLLQIVLFGQPELDENLAAPEIRQLRERITHGFTLKILSSDETREYMEFRLRAAGYRGREAFSSKAYKVMHKASEGLTRRVNILADKSLLAAFADDTHDVSERHVKVAIQDTQLSVPQSRGSSPPWLFKVAGLVLAAALGWVAASWYVGGDRQPGPEPAVAGSVPQPAATPARPAPAPATVDRAVAPAPAAPQASDQTPVLEPRPAGETKALNAEVIEKPPGDDRKVAGTSNPAAPAGADVQPVTTVPAAEPVRDAPLLASPPAATPGNDLAASRRPSLPEAVSEQSSGSQEPAVRSMHPPAQPRASAPPVTGSEPGRSYSRSAQPTTVVSGTPQDTPAATPVATPAATPAPEPDPAAGSDQAQTAVTVVVATRAPDTVPQAALAGSSEGPGTGNLLDQRLAQTRVWLKRVNPRYYSIQVLATAASKKKNLLDFLRRRVDSGRIQDIYVYVTTIDKRPWYGVLYGEFSEYSKARQALRELPRTMTRHRPFIRNISDISASK